MSKFHGAKAGYEAGKQFLKNIFKPSKVSPTITKVAPKFPKNKIQAAVRDVQKTAYAARGQMKKRSQDFDRDIQKVKLKLGQSMQKLKGEPVTESGFSKGKNIIKKAKGGRIGYNKGTPGKAIEKKGIPIIIVTKSGEQKMKKLPLTENKAKGGRIGYRRGTSKNVQKIKKTFGPKSLGMQSIIYGLDKNPNVTKADPKAKFIAAANKKKKKKVI